MIDEEWRPVPEWSRYEISNHCRARNLETGRLLKPIYDPTCRYVRYCFRQHGRQLTKNAHRIMWRAFHGDVQDGLVLNHKDGNRQNNIITNLELVTSSENNKHAVALGLARSGENHPTRDPLVRLKLGRRLSEETARAILAQTQSATVSEVARTHGVSRRTVEMIAKGITWKRLHSAATFAMRRAGSVSGSR